MAINLQYAYMFEKGGAAEIMGPVASSTWTNDPKRLLFSLSRYKFVAKMFAGMENVLEIGCGDAWASRIVAQHVQRLTAIDYDHRFIDAARNLMSQKWPINLHTNNPLHCADGQLGVFDAVYLLDVFEHIPSSEEDLMLKAIKANLKDTGSVIIGMPSLESQNLIPIEKRDPGHVNCKHGVNLLDLMRKHFDYAFLFSMNDEVVHTGHYSMAHYLLVLCCGPRR